MVNGTADFVVLSALTWRSPPLAAFEAMAATIEARFGPPSARDLDSNGIGLFDAHCLRFSCGLEVGLWRFHLGKGLRPIDREIEPSAHEIYANERDLRHVAFHLGVPVDAMSLWSDTHLEAGSVLVMRTDDNGNDAEVKRVTSQCEAEAIVRMYEARGHKQSYWIAARSM